MTAGQDQSNPAILLESVNGTDFIRNTIPGAGVFTKLLIQWWQENHRDTTKTKMGHGVDFYHDLVLTHASEAYSALAWFEQDSVRSLSYGGLARSVHDLSQRWAAQSLAPGVSVAIICSKGYRRLTALLTAFRLGLVPSLLDPSGPAWITAQLQVLQCDVIYTESAYHAVIPDEQKSRILRLDKMVSIPEGFSASYAFDSPVLRIFSNPFGIDSRVVNLTAQHVYLNLLRDAFFILDLKKGNRIAAPSRSNGAGSPFLEMAAFLSGSSITIIDRKEWSYAAPYLLSSPFDCVGLESEGIAHLRTHLSSLDNNIQWGRWFRSPLDNDAMLDWSHFGLDPGVNKIPRAEILWCASAAGIGLGTVWSHNLYDSLLHAPPGLTWYLGETATPENQSLIPFGRFCPVFSDWDKELSTPTDLLLSANPDGCRYLGRYNGDAESSDYPAALVRQVLAGTCCWHVIVERPPESFVQKPERVLLAFMEERSVHELNAIIRSEISDEVVPDKIEIFNLVPHLIPEGVPDAEWCKSLYFKGELHRRSKIRIHVLLSQLKKTVLLSRSTGLLPPHN